MICADDRPCPTVAFFNEEAIGGRVQGDAAGDSFASRSNRTSAAAISCLFLCGDDAASSVYYTGHDCSVYARANCGLLLSVCRVVHEIEMYHK